MMNRHPICLAVWVTALAAMFSLSAAGSDLTLPGRWTPDKAKQGYARQPWLVGCNFTPSTAINPLEMWQADTFDPATIDRELGWAAAVGMNTVRVYLHDLLRPDGSPFRQSEVDLIKSLTTEKKN